jgi:hypothetical protein
MPQDREFIDAQAKRGRPSRAPIARKNFRVNSPSRSLNLASADQHLGRVLRCEIRQTGYLHIDFNQIINDGKIKIARTYAIGLAQWILEVFGDTNASATDTKKADVARKSKSHRRISSSSDEVEP